jgi:Tfp pilus assembly protein PilF
MPGLGPAAQQLPSNHNYPGESPSADASLRQAQELIQQGLFDQARKIINAQLERNPSVDGYNLLGIACTNEKDYEHAADAFQQALTLAPNSTKTHNNLANLYVAQEKVDLAEKEFTKVLSLSPTNRDANYNLGLLLIAKGKPLAAIQHLQRVHPATIETRFNLVRAYFQAGKPTEALNTARELSAAHKQDVQLHFTLGLLLATAKQYKSAQLELEQANALQSETFEIPLQPRAGLSSRARIPESRSYPQPCSKDKTRF